jgi:hypothetical protein
MPRAVSTACCVSSHAVAARASAWIASASSFARHWRALSQPPLPAKSAKSANC